MSFASISSKFIYKLWLISWHFETLLSTIILLIPDKILIYFHEWVWIGEHVRKGVMNRDEWLPDGRHRHEFLAKSLRTTWTIFNSNSRVLFSDVLFVWYDCTILSVCSITSKELALLPFVSLASSWTGHCRTEGPLLQAMKAAVIGLYGKEKQKNGIRCSWAILKAVQHTFMADCFVFYSFLTWEKFLVFFYTLWYDINSTHHGHFKSQTQCFERNGLSLLITYLLKTKKANDQSISNGTCL